MNLTKQIFSDTVIYSAATVIGKLAGFLLLPFYSSIFQTQGYGILGILETSLGMLSLLFSRGFSNGLLRYYHEEDDARKGIVITTSLILLWILSAIIIPIPFLLSSKLSAFILGSPQYAHLIKLSLLTLVFETTGSCASNYLVITRKPVHYSAISLIKLFAGLSLNILLVIVLRMGLFGVFISSLITSMLTAVIFHWPVMRNFGMRFDRIIAIKLIRYQSPMIPGDFVSFLSRQTERVLIRVCIGLESVGILEIGYKFAPLLNLMISIPFFRSWRTKSFEIGAQPDAPDIIGRMISKYAFVMTAAGLIMAATIDDVLKMLTPRDFWGASSIARIEIVTTIIVGMMGMLDFGLMYRKKTFLASKIVSVCSLIKIGLSYVIIANFGIKGAAYSACIAASIQALLIARYSQRCYRVKIEYSRLAAIAITGFMVYGGIRWVDSIHFHIFSFANDWAAAKIAVLRHLPLFHGARGEKIVSLLLTRREALLSAASNGLLASIYLLVCPLLWWRFFAEKVSRLSSKGDTFRRAKRANTPANSLSR